MDVTDAGPAGPDPVEQRILDAAVEAASIHGLGRLSVADVAKRAGLSRPTVYTRFASKDALVAAAVERELRTAVDVVLGAVEGLDDPKEALAAAVLAALRLAREHPLLDRVVRTEPELLVPLLTTDDALLVIRLPAEAIVADRLPGLGPVANRRLADGLARLLVSYALSAPDDPPEVVAEVVAEVLVGGALAMSRHTTLGNAR